MALFELLIKIFGHLSVDDPRTPGDFGISVARRGGAGPRLLPELLNVRLSMLRTRSIPRLIRRLDAALGNIARAPDPDVWRPRMVGAVVTQDGAALVPESMFARSTAVERAIVDAGARLAEPVAVRLDLAHGEVVVVPGLVQPDVIEGYADDLVTPPGRFPLRGIFWSPEQVAPDERAATGISRLAQLIERPPTSDRQALLDGLLAAAPLMSTTPVGPTTADLAMVLSAFQ